MADKKRGIPMDRLVNSEDNMYELTNAAIHRAGQISVTGEAGADENEKIISRAISEIVTEEVKYEYKR